MRRCGIIVALSCLAACSTAPPPSWHQDVAPILAQHCMSCHREGGIAPFSLTDVDSARRQALRMIEQIELGTMPPFNAQAAPDCAPRFGWVGDPRLSPSEKATLQAWIDDGYLLGDPAPPPAIVSQDLADVGATLTPTEGWTASGDRDQFICYLLDVGNQDTAWLSGLQVRPGDTTTVHHALIYAFAPDEAQALVTAHDFGRPFECGGGLPGQLQIHAWFPGNQPLQLPAGMAMPMVPGTVIGVQIHYHPHSGVYGEDRTALDLQFAPGPPEHLYVTASFGNESMGPNLLPGPDDTQDGVPEFIVPRNVADHLEHMRIGLGAVTSGARLVSVLPHMHLLGTRLAMTIERPEARDGEPQSECLANGAWNFDWQRTYAFDAPFDRLPSIAGGDTIDLQCRWNNTLDNPFARRLLADTSRVLPFDVSLGEQTTNEMCLAVVGIALPAPGK